MNTYEAIMTRRSIRKFRQEPLKREDLEKLVKAASVTAYPANIQPLKFKIIEEKAMVEEVFKCTKWAGYIPDGTPQRGEEPVAYIGILGDTNIKKGTDFQVENGAAGTVITIAAHEMGIGSCWIGSVNRERVRELLNLPDNLVMIDLIALGYPAQKSRAVEMQEGDVKYWLDKDGTMNVPKRCIDEILI